MAFETKELPGAVDGFASLPSAYYAEESEVHLRDYLRVLRKHRWVVLACLAAAIFLASVYTFTRVPMFSAVATLQIDRDAAPVALDGRYGGSEFSQEYIATQLKVITSRSMARRVVVADESLRKLIRPTGGKLDMEQSYAPAINDALAGLEVVPVRGTRMVEIRYSASNALKAQRLANAFAEQFIQSSLESRFQTTQEATAFLAEQVERLQQEIKEKESELLRYGTEVDILTSNAENSIVAQQMTAASNAYISAQADRIQKEIHYKDLEKAGPNGRPELVNHPFMMQLQGQLAAMHQKYAEMGAKFKPDWPDMIHMRQQIEAMQAQIDSERQRVYLETVAAAKSEYEMAIVRERTFAAQLEAEKVATSQLNQNAIYYNTLKLEIDNKKGLLEELLKRQSETGVQARLSGAKTSNIRIVDRAELPRLPYSPNHTQNLGLGLLLGIGLGVGLALFLEYLDNTVKSPEDLYRMAQLPALGVVPKLATNSKRGLLTDGAGRPEAIVLRQQSVQEAIIQAGQSEFAEAFKSVRSSVLLSSMDHPPHVLLVTSSVPSEGKTTTAVSLAISIAQTDKNVLLIDADMRRPQIHRVLEISNRLGLSNILAGQGVPNQAIQKTKIKGLFALTCGPLPPNPSELLSGRRMKGLIAGCRKVFDMVVIDSPPAMSFADAVQVGALTDGVVLVVEAGETPKEVLLRVRRRFEEVHVRILGVVLNKADLESEGYYYYSKYYYRYYGSPPPPEAQAGAADTT